MKQFLYKPFHPFLIGAYPIIFLAARNSRYISLIDLVRPLLLGLMVTTLLLGSIRLILREWQRPALLASLALVLLFSYGHLAGAFPSTSPYLLAWAWLVIFLAAGLLILLHKRYLPLTAFFNIVGLLLVSAALFTLIKSESTLYAADNTDSAALAQVRGQAQAEAGAQVSTGRDIYYIVLDSYERSDALQKYYHFDNSSFIQALKDRGFFIADHSRSNYLSTMLSIPAAFNMLYLNDLPASLYTRLTSSLQINHTTDFLRSQGYKIVQFESGFASIDNSNHDIWMSDNPPLTKFLFGPVTQLELLLLHTSPEYILFGSKGTSIESPEEITSSLNIDFVSRRARINYTFQHLPDLASSEGNYFIYAHLISPHNPYIFGPHGEIINFDGNYFLLGNKSDPDTNIKLYTDQLQYDNQQILAAIDRILAQSKEPPVIILQSDHGHDTYFDWNAVTPQGVDLRSAILMAYYFPDQDYSTLYHSISPVNVFRVVFNKYFNTQYPLLTDRTYGYSNPAAAPVGSKPDFIDYQSYLSQLPN